ncbi:MAG: hypothetical protein H0X64_08180 [Gemmatimonadaceae bacterium]|nr:hypothetical protein [Gemmatimonadaceae bacterium]
MTYAAEHADALAELRAAGAPVTFTSWTPGVYDPSTATRSARVPITVTGYALRVKPSSQLDRAKYQALELITSEAVTLLFAPDEYGRLPELGATADFAGVRYTVRDREPIAPDGVAIMARIVVAGGGPVPVTAAAAFALPPFALAGAARLQFTASGAFAPALQLAGVADNGILFVLDASLTGATFSRSTTATYTAEIPDLVFALDTALTGATSTRSTTATYTAEV